LVLEVVVQAVHHQALEQQVKVLLVEVATTFNHILPVAVVVHPKLVKVIAEQLQVMVEQESIHLSQVLILHMAVAVAVDSMEVLQITTMRLLVLVVLVVVEMELDHLQVHQVQQPQMVQLIPVAVAVVQACTTLQVTFQKVATAVLAS
jgi:hypothetical protein